MIMRLVGLVLACLLVGPAFAQQPQRPAQPQPAPQFTLKNEGEVTLYELYVARGGQGARGWGQDRLGSEVVPPGESFRVRLPAGFGCVVDIRIVFEGGEEEVRERIDVCREREVAFARSVPAAAQPERELAVENGADRTIQNLFISGVEETEWGEDRLGSGIIARGGRFVARFPDLGCAYDVRVVFDNGGAEERRRLDLCALAALVIRPGWTTAETLGAPAGPGQGAVTIVNRSGRTVFEIFVFPDGAADRGPDRLGADTMADGASIRVPAFSPPACSGTLALSYDDRQREERRGIDLCTAAEIVIAPGWTGADPAPAGGGAAGGAGSPGTIGLVNRSGRVVFEIFTFPDGAAESGPDRLGSEIMRPGGTLRVPAARPPACATTLRVVYENGDREDRTGLDFCTLAEVVIEPRGVSALPPRFGSIVNAGSAPIIALHADPPGAPRGPDRLGDAVIGIGQRMALPPPDAAACTYDITAVFRDRRTARVAGADLCGGAEIRIAP